MNEHDDLSPAERRAFHALPRDKEPPADLEDRVVRALRARGLLPIPLRPASRSARRTATWLVGAIAASLALFASGVAVGQYLGARSATVAALVGARSSASDVATHLERAGSLYVAALASYSQLRDAADAATQERARRAALKALGAAAEEVALLAPDDPLAASVLRGLAERARERRPAPPSRSLVWF